MGTETLVVQLDSATKFRDVHREHVVICGSHGGVYCGYLAASAGLRAVILNDAGIGLDQAGLGALAYCEDLGMAAATCAICSTACYLRIAPTMGWCALCPTTGQSHKPAAGDPWAPGRP